MATLRADHVGSFLRPPELLEARRAYAAGQISDDRLREAEDSSIRKILELLVDTARKVWG
jgi:5-methyltetrahydropteroyltriglutamate--homocysteine methyltransferase